MMASILRGACALLLVAVMGCGGKADKAATPTPAAPAAGPTGVLKDLQNGDRACYVVLDVDGTEQSLEGDFELCAGGGHDATALIGQRVSVTTHKDKVTAAACEGAPDCAQSDEVDLVDAIVAAP